MNNKKASLVMVSALALLIMVSGAAYAQDQKKQAVDEKELQEKSMQTIAKEMGIDPTGLTNEQIKKAFAEKAVDVKSTASKQVEKKPITPEQIHNNRLSIATELGIDTKGMTDQQIDDALRAEKVKRSAKEIGFDPSGMTNEQIKKAISEKANDMKSATSQRVEKKPITPEQRHNDLLSSAMELGIDTTGMTDQQIDDALRAEKIKRSAKQ